MISITGATGFIGSYLCDKLPMPKKILVRSANSFLDPNIEVHRGDLANFDSAFISNSACLIHLACHSNPRISSSNLVKDLESNLAPTVHLFERYAKLNPGGHILFASSGGNMYEDTPFTAPKTEEDIPQPRSGYGIHKLAAEHYLRLIAESAGIRATILRISNPYGAWVDASRLQGLIGVAFAKLQANEVLQVYDSKETLRDYIHLEDVVSAIRIVMDNQVSGTFNISSGIGISIAQVIQEIESVSDKKMRVEYTEESFQKKPSWSILSSEKAKKELGWQPSISFSEGLLSMQQALAIHN